MLQGLLIKILSSSLVAGFKEWLANRTAQQAGAAKQKIKDQEARDKGAEDVRKIKNIIRTDSSKRDRVRAFFNRDKSRPPSN